MARRKPLVFHEQAGEVVMTDTICSDPRSTYVVYEEI